MAMIHKTDISVLIQHAILSMCRETYDLEAEVEIDGLICFHDCKKREYNIVKLHEIFKSGEKSHEAEYGMHESVDLGNGSNIHQQIHTQEEVEEPYSPSSLVHLSSQNSGHNDVSYVDLSQSNRKSTDDGGSYDYTTAGYNIYDAGKNYILSRVDSSPGKDSIESKNSSEKSLNERRIKKARMDCSNDPMSKNRGNKFSGRLEKVVVKAEPKSNTVDEDITDGSTNSENFFEDKNNFSPSHGESTIHSSTFSQTDMIKCMNEMKKALAGNSHQSSIQGTCNEFFKGVSIKVEPPDESETLSLNEDKLPFSQDEHLQTLGKEDAFHSDLFHEQEISRLPFENCETDNNLLDEYSRHYESDDNRSYETSKSKPDASPDFVNSVNSATVSPVTGNLSLVHNGRSFSNNSISYLKGKFSDHLSSVLGQQEFSGELLFKQTDPKKQNSTLISSTDDFKEEDSHGLFMIKPGWLASEIQYRSDLLRSSRPVTDNSENSHCSTADRLSQPIVLVSDRELDDGNQIHDSFERQLLSKLSSKSDDSQRLSNKVHMSKGSYESSAQEQQSFTSPKAYQKVGKFVSPGTSQSRGKGVFFCSKCGARFTFRQSRDRHEKSSCGIPLISPYPCEICGKLFKRKDYLKTHREKFHPVSKRTDNDISSVKMSSSF
ncbi:hypothetical protein CHS0354_030537 [Potamilus streckersoni]|uniref:C2H2-type domain-containing protein n=1 Tax=Potamilus streckersoni TaxID=2493646 RepID=A0AAE0RPB9_9BIVA|nr:hypothetical protein CHS0354_030537 [Potamilus streckersoni]